jgi:galactofuranosylgalactofuranosylrhamnosyl-N-acetylglucosaminyl-diphospho-decaprenol beta-1,5/1,6-galactofuranosyltransferase
MKNIVGRIKFSKSTEASALYIQCNEAVTVNYQEIDQGIRLRQGGSISSSSYFNSFYESYYSKYTNVSSIYYLLRLEGSFRIAVYREKGGDNREKVFEDNFENCQPSTPVILPSIALLQEDKAGRLYVEMTCLSEEGIFQEGCIITDEEKEQEVSLGIVICTFKKEDYVKNTLATLLQDKLLQDKDFKVFLVDNGRTLDASQFSDPRVHLIPNKNAGGSGGFTRGLMEGLADRSRSHFLVMDDDIELESESIYRLFGVHEYAKRKFVVAGGLLSLIDKCTMHEAGATYNPSPQVRGQGGTLTALNHRMDLSQNDALNQLLIEEDADYGGFWFCSFSREILEAIDLPLPLFIKLDDVEFCLRAKRALNIPIVTFPSIAVWHLPASAKDLNWETYYYFRNDFITYAIHFSPDYDALVTNLTKQINDSFAASNYDRAHVIIRALDDYLKGSSFIMGSEPDVWHPHVLKLSRMYESREAIDDEAIRQELLADWADVVEKTKVQGVSVSEDWKNAAKEMTSLSFWQRYLDVGYVTA